MPKDKKSGEVFITTFETCTENNKTVIKSKNKKVTQAQDFLVEEVLSEPENEEETSEKIINSDVQIEEVFEEQGIAYVNYNFYIIEKFLNKNLIRIIV